MHELSIADAIVEIATAHSGGRRVTKVAVKVGHLRQVVPSALEFSFELVADGTPVEGATLELEIVPAEGHCRDCGSETVMPGFPLCCAVCGGVDMEVIRGEELLVDSLEVEDEDAMATSGGMTHGGRC